MDSCVWQGRDVPYTTQVLIVSRKDSHKDGNQMPSYEKIDYFHKTVNSS